jgi:hypothetical protein
MCLGCLGLIGLVPSTSPEIKTTALEKVSEDVDTYFADNKKIYTNANQTIEALSGAQGTFKLTGQDYKSMIRAIVDGESYDAPKHLSQEQSTALLSTMAEATALQAALADSAAKTKEAATFLSSKTATIESELVTLRGNYEMIQRNPLASRRDKGKAANQIRKANKLGSALKARAIEHHKELLGLQRKTLTALQGWSINLKGLGKEELEKAAVSSAKEQGQSTLVEHAQAIEAKTNTALETGLQKASAELEVDPKLIENTRSTLQGAGAQVEDTATQLDGKVDAIKKDAKVQAKSLQKNASKTINETKSSIQESASETIESSDEDPEEE